MTKNEKNQLQKKWWMFCDNLEEKIEDASSVGDGILFIILLPLWAILKTTQWLLYLLGSWIIKVIPTKD